jgi:hypothetical protein
VSGHLLLLVEELSMEAFLRAFLPRVLPAGQTFEVFSFQGKSDMLAKLPQRLRAYAAWLPADWRIVVLLDRDDDDCRNLKRDLEDVASSARLRTRTQARGGAWQVVNRIAIEELEAWYFGDWPAVCAAYPRMPPNAARAAPFRDPDAIRGGTWEAFERVLQRHGYFKAGLPKIEVARRLGALLDPARSRSRSLQVLMSALRSE